MRVGSLSLQCFQRQSPCWAEASWRKKLPDSDAEGTRANPTGGIDGNMGVWVTDWDKGEK